MDDKPVITRETVKPLVELLGKSPDASPKIECLAEVMKIVALVQKNPTVSPDVFEDIIAIEDGRKALMGFFLMGVISTLQDSK
jgi:hypothetical protein